VDRAADTATPRSTPTIWPIVPQSVGTYGPSGPINSGLKDLNSLQILDKIIASAGRDGRKVILDDHRSEAGESAEQNGLCYTAAYTGQNGSGTGPCWPAGTRATRRSSASTGHRVTAENASYDATIAAGGSVTIGLIGARPARGAAPATVAVGGRSCS
jgi:hypothetical protein